MFIKGLLLLLAANCLSAGRLLPQPEARIFGGHETDIESSPWQVSLRFNEVHFCGGSIYSETIIITAAHCLYDEENLLKPENLTVLAGSAYKFSSETVVKVAAIKPHTDYTNTLRANDIGIVKLRTPLDLTTQKMKKINLAKDDPAPGTEVIVTGWGDALEFKWNDPKLLSALSPPFLQSAKIQIQKPYYCNKVYGTVPKTICAGTTNRTTCDGDSGGPMVDNKLLAGVVSFNANPCASLTLYTSVSEYRGWIEKEAESI